MLRLTITILLIALSGFLSTVHGHNVIHDDFKTTSCGDPNIQVVLKMIPAKTTSSISSIQCAIFCQRTQICRYAIFNDRNKTCEQVYGLTNELRSSVIHEDAKGENCIVLTKVVRELWTLLDDKTLTSLNTLDRFADLKLVKETPNKFQLVPVSHFLVDKSGGFSLATNGKSLSTSFDDSVQFDEPYRSKVYFVQGSSTADALTVLVILTINNGQIYKSHIQDTPPYCMWRRVKLEADISVANNFQEALNLLMKGHRTLERHPTRIIVDSSSRQIHLDMIEMTSFPDPLTKTPTHPIYFKSIKETVGDKETGTRYVLEHQVFGNKEEPYQVTSDATASFPRVFDSTWYKLDGELHELFYQLVQGIQQGKPIRVMLGQAITDIASVYITPTDIQVSTSPYIHPFRGSDSQTAASRYIRYTLCSLSNAFIQDCQANSLKGDGPYTALDNYMATPYWFVSTKTWTQLFVKRHNQTVDSTSLQSLRQAVFDGKNIRVCVDDSDEDKGTLFYCLTPKTTSASWKDKHVIFSSVAFINPHEAFATDPLVECPDQRALLISTEGWIKAMTLAVGSKDKSTVSLEFKTLYWFAEMD